MSEIKGKVIAVLPQTSGQGKNGEWKSQDFVVETDGQYPKKVCLNIYGGKLPMPSIDDMVTVSFDPESREYNGRWFTNLRAFKIEGGSTKAEPIQSQPQAVSEGSDLPF